MTEEREYPRWVHFPGTIPGKKSALVNDAAAETAQLQAWGVASPAANLLMPEHLRTETIDLSEHAPDTVLATDITQVEPFDHDRNGTPGGSLKGTGDDLPALRIAYKEKFGKRAFPGWNAAEITKRMAAD